MLWTQLTTFVSVFFVTVQSWDLKGPAEKYWNLRKLGLHHHFRHHLSSGSSSLSPPEVGHGHHEVPPSSASHNNPSYLSYSSSNNHYHHSMTPTHYVNYNNRVSLFEKNDRSLIPSTSSSSASSFLETSSSPSPPSSLLSSSSSAKASSPNGCSYKGRRYHHLENVVTTQPCLNCTCLRGFVSCYLKVCPRLTPPENDDSCYLLKELDSCCPVLTCQDGTKVINSSSSGVYSLPEPQPLTSHGHGAATERKEESMIQGRGSTSPTYNPRLPVSGRPPYNYWSSHSKRTTTTTTSRPFSLHGSRPTLKSLTTTLRPTSATNNRNFSKSPSFATTRKPIYPTNNYSRRRSTSTTSTTSTTIRPRNFSTLHSLLNHQNELDHHLGREGLSSGNHRKESKDFFRMSAILV